MISLAVVQGIEEIGETVAASYKVDLFIDNQSTLAQFVVDQHIDVGQATAHHRTDEVSNRGHADEGAEVTCVMVTVETSDGFSHGVNAVGKGEERVYRTEEIWRHLNRVEAGSARNLDEGKDHRDASAHVAKRRHQAIGNAQIAQADDDCGTDISHCIGMLHSNGKVADGHDERLGDGKEGE